MSIFSLISSHRSKNRVRRVAQENIKHAATRTEYLLNEKTPFNVTEAFRNLKASISVSVPKKSEGGVIMATSAYPEVNMNGKALPAKGIFFRNVDGLVLDNVKVDTYLEDVRKEDFVFENVQNCKVIN